MNWRRIGPNYWMTTEWDVWRTNGVWYASFYLGARESRDFPTAAAAKRYVERLRSS